MREGGRFDGIGAFHGEQRTADGASAIVALPAHGGRNLGMLAMDTTTVQLDVAVCWHNKETSYSAATSVTITSAATWN